LDLPRLRVLLRALGRLEDTVPVHAPTATCPCPCPCISAPPQDLARASLQHPSTLAQVCVKSVQFGSGDQQAAIRKVCVAHPHRFRQSSLPLSWWWMDFVGNTCLSRSTVPLLQEASKTISSRLPNSLPFKYEWNRAGWQRSASTSTCATYAKSNHLVWRWARQTTTWTA
jgi:hypothetical protein